MALPTLLDDELAASWRTSEGQMQVIGEAGLFPLLVARLTWADRLKGQEVLVLLGQRLGYPRG
eukprot:4272051-Karenia_brevis.AAC.1